MDERSSKKKKREHDFAVTAFRVVREATGQVEPSADTVPESPEELTPEERHDAAVKLGRLGGKKGGPARAAKLTPEERRAIAKNAAKSRWQR